MVDRNSNKRKPSRSAARPSKARANTIKYNNEIQQPLTVLHAERPDNPERKERHNEHVQVSRVRVVP